MSRLSALQIVDEIGVPEMVTSEQLNLTRRKLARLRSNLKAIRYEISDRLLIGTQDCRKSILNTMDALGEINVAVQHQNK